METRKILIANNKTQRRYTINTNATTLGELQDEMTAQGIDFTGMTFTEGITKTELLSRESMLPTNVMFKGQPTNDLVMLLTNSTKNISSGASTRQNVYALVKRYGLQESIKQKYGKNFTMVSTPSLIEEIENCPINVNTGVMVNPTTGEEEIVGPDKAAEFQKNRSALKKVREELSNKPEPAKIPDVKTAPHPEAVEWYYMGVKAMVKSGLLYPDDVAVIADLTTDLYKRLSEEKPVISDKDIDDMIACM